MSQEEKKEKKEDTLNKDAKEFIPSKNRLPQKLDFNLNAKEYKPKPTPPVKEKIEYVEADDDDEDNDEQVKDQIDKMMGDEIENEVRDELENQGKLGNNSDDSADEDKWFPKYKDCECCKGFVYKCSGEACTSLGQCYCKMKDDVDDDDGGDNNKEKDKEKENKKN